MCDVARLPLINGSPIMLCPSLWVLWHSLCHHMLLLPPSSFPPQHNTVCPCPSALHPARRATIHCSPKTVLGHGGNKGNHFVWGQGGRKAGQEWKGWVMEKVTSRHSLDLGLDSSSE